MRKIAAVLCTAVLASVFLTSCGSASDVSRVELTKNGKIIEYTVEDFTAFNYDEEELEIFIEDEIDAFLEENDGSVKVKKESVKKGLAYLTLRFSSVDVYSDFNGVECFSGTVEEAMEAGYNFTMNFTVAQDEDKGKDDSEEGTSVSGSTVSGSTVIADDSVRVLIIETDMNVVVPGEVVYYYTTYGQADWDGGDTVLIDFDVDFYGENNLVYVLYKK